MKIKFVGMLSFACWDNNALKIEHKGYSRGFINEQEIVNIINKGSKCKIK